jgi:glutamate synthase (NADPH/NADH) large chain
VILGDTGRNFAAGMSGGVAYVYDPKTLFAAKCNMEMVDLETLDAEDKVELEAMLQNHFNYTKSDVAESILKNVEGELKNFIKVMPRDYKAVLLKKKQQNKKEALLNG